MQQKESFCCCHVYCKWDRPWRGDRSVQRGRSVIYDCLVLICECLLHCAQQQLQTLQHKSMLAVYHCSEVLTFPWEGLVFHLLQLVGRLRKSSTGSQWNNWLPWPSDIFCWKSKTACEGAAARLVAFVNWLSIWRCPRTLFWHFVRFAGMCFIHGASDFAITEFRHWYKLFFENS